MLLQDYQNLIGVYLQQLKTFSEGIVEEGRGSTEGVPIE